MEDDQRRYKWRTIALTVLILALAFAMYRDVSSSPGQQPAAVSPTTSN